MTLSFVLVCSMIIAFATCTRPKLTISLLQPQGIRFNVEDQAGLSLIAFHYCLNSRLEGTTAGDYNYDVTSKTGDQWVHENRRVNVRPGDTLYFWWYYVISGGGHNVLDQSWSPEATMEVPQDDATSSDVDESMPDPIMPDPIMPDSNVQPSPVTNNRPLNRPTNPKTNSNGCTEYPCMIFEDEFNFLNHDVWEHEITASGGGNWEFQYYTNNRSNSYVRDGKLFIKPTLTVDTIAMGPDSLTRGALDLWGSNPGDVCTGNAWWGCRREGSPNNILSPIQSARLRSSRGFNFKYGKVEVMAKMPNGDWLWPAIWMLPLRSAYGQWPASGEIDIVEARGNREYTDNEGNHKGTRLAGCTLHFGSDFRHNKFWRAHGSKLASSGSFADSFHKYVLIWDENHISMSIDDTEVLNVSPEQTMWEYGGNDRDNVENPWAAGGKMAPFDQDFFLILNVAVGGSAYFPDHLQNPGGKPWSDQSGTAPRDFWNARNKWYPTWNPFTNNGEDAAMQVDYIRVWKLQP